MAGNHHAYHMDIVLNLVEYFGAHTILSLTALKVPSNCHYRSRGMFSLRTVTGNTRRRDYS
ncbi:hypothetical protein GQ55_5G108700 [Panicum hallii var. hallii]|uniref:Uncharacterized protein n=1 Tax=Panicum hallii var. hallii TaxID=1504633 RepID=A0A2T7DF47_9POAL|nr:hypothetical protein GQ55_5G108700 [Panicum hallii var. hallii]